MKHAYLIIAHNEFEVLRRLVAALDDKRSDIFIHYDRKVRALPEIATEKSDLHVLEDRVDVKWGTVSQIKAEYALFEAAGKVGGYSHYILISGTHFPLVGNDRIASFLAENEGNSILPCMENASDYQVDMKMRRVNILPGTIVWRAFLKIQRLLGIRINRSTRFYNAGNWVCLSESAMRYLVERKKTILKKYRFSFCGDEFFVPTELMASSLADTVVFSRELLKFEIGRSNARVYTLEDYDELMASGCLFARKFDGVNMNVVNMIYKWINRK